MSVLNFISILYQFLSFDMQPPKKKKKKFSLVLCSRCHSLLSGEALFFLRLYTFDASEYRFPNLLLLSLCILKQNSAAQFCFVNVKNKK